MLADKQLNAGQGIWLMTSTAAALAPHFPDLSFPPSFQVCHCQVPSQTYLHQKSAPFCQPEDSTKLKKLLLLSEIWHLSRHFFLFEDSSCSDSSSSSSGSSAQFLKLQRHHPSSIFSSCLHPTQMSFASNVPSIKRWKYRQKLSFYCTHMTTFWTQASL